MRRSILGKLRFLTYISLIPLALLTVFLLYNMSQYSNRYNQIVKNITAANEYNLAFKENIDYTMYQVVINGPDPVAKYNSEELVDPYQTIADVRKVFEDLQKISGTKNNRERIERIIKSTDTLQKRIDDLYESAEIAGNYDENIYKLDTNIYILTDIIQEQIQEYIYYEARSLETTRQAIADDINKTLTISIIFFSAILIVTWTLADMISGGISFPIRKLCDMTGMVAKGDFKVRADINTKDEITTLANSFNSMIEKIGSLIEDVKTEQLNLRAMELRLLQAQINPHFLYNTLDTIIWLAEDGKKEQVVAMVTSLSDFIRVTLSNGKDIISIAEEEAHIVSYLKIQHSRYHDILDYTVSIPSEIKSFKMVKLTLQPLVENALYHGIKHKRKKGLIEISAHMSGRDVIFIVKDNGIGMKKETMDKLNDMISGEEPKGSREGFGLSNVNERIRLMYGKEYGLYLESEYEAGTKAIVKIPVRL